MIRSHHATAGTVRLRRRRDLDFRNDVAIETSDLLISYHQMDAASGARPFRVLVVDDRVMPRIAARAMLATAPDLELVAEATSGADAVAIASGRDVDVVLLDVDMREMDGASTARALLARKPDLTILAWTVSDASDDLVRMMQAGCVGYVLKDVGPEELQRAIRAGIRREAAVPRKMLPEVLKRAVPRAYRDSDIDGVLTDRELETLRLVAKGLPTKRIAIEMGISPASVDTHLRNTYRKLDAGNRSEAVSKAVRTGLLGITDL
jgi:DNA-binding NarL/FixJ family response regulator